MLRNTVSGLTVAALCIGMTPSYARPPADKEAQQVQAALQVVAQRKVQLMTAPAERGCIGKDAATCIASISFYVHISSTQTEGVRGYLVLPKPVERDLNGEPMVQTVQFISFITPIGKPGSAPIPIVTKLTLGDGAHVDTVQFNLVNAPLFASTKEDWDATGVYELAVAAIGFDCVGRDRLAFYKLYDKAQHEKPLRTYDSSSADPGITDYLGGTIQMCDFSIGIQDYNDVTKARTGHGSYFYISRAKAAAGGAPEK